MDQTKPWLDFILQHREPLNTPMTSQFIRTLWLWLTIIYWWGWGRGLALSESMLNAALASQQSSRGVAVWPAARSCCWRAAGGSRPPGCVDAELEPFWHISRFPGDSIRVQLYVFGSSCNMNLCVCVCVCVYPTLRLHRKTQLDVSHAVKTLTTMFL